jgi:hypothetical protein
MAMPDSLSDVYIDDSIAAVRALHRHSLEADRSQQTIRQLLEQLARTIHEQHRRGNAAVCFHLTCWCNEFIGRSAEHILSAELTLAQAQQTIATEHGFSQWTDVQALGDELFDAEFERAVDCVVMGNLSTLTTLLQQQPQLATQTSQYHHRATLLHYVAANGVETHRQVSPANLPAITTCLIDAGADVNASANMYGGSATTLGLLLTSAHPANAGVVDEVAALLRAAGAQ